MTPSTQVRVPISEAEKAKFKEWCDSQKPRRSMGAQIRMWIENALASRKGRKG